MSSSPTSSPTIMNRKQACMSPEQIKQKMNENQAMAKCLEHMSIVHSYSPPRVESYLSDEVIRHLGDEEEEDQKQQQQQQDYLAETSNKKSTLPPPPPPFVTSTTPPPEEEDEEEPNRISSYLEHVQFCSP